MFNVACVFVAYFLWFYRKVAPSSGRLAHVGGVTSDLVAAVLLGLATFSKPVPNGLLLIPPVIDAFWQGDRRSAASDRRGDRHGGGGRFSSINGFISGELNYQGGMDRRTFYSGAGGFPFEPGVSFEDSGIRRATNAVVVEERLDVTGFLSLLGHNARYFLLGRHFGFVPFFFPGVVAVCLFLATGARRDGWRWWILGTAMLCAVGLMIYMPYTWSGGGGPPGNRYFLSVYPAIFFLTPVVTTTLPALVALVGGALFLVQILTNPFVAAKQPYLSVEHGALRWLPVELTMVNDLPIMLDGARSRVRYGRDPQLLLYYLDHSAWLPEAPGNLGHRWRAGRGHRPHGPPGVAERRRHASFPAWPNQRTRRARRGRPGGGAGAGATGDGDPGAGGGLLETQLGLSPVRRAARRVRAPTRGARIRRTAGFSASR